MFYTLVFLFLFLFLFCSLQNLDRPTDTESIHGHCLHIFVLKKGEDGVFGNGFNLIRFNSKEKKEERRKWGWYYSFSFSFSFSFLVDCFTCGCDLGCSWMKKTESKKGWDEEGHVLLIAKEG